MGLGTEASLCDVILMPRGGHIYTFLGDDLVLDDQPSIWDSGDELSDVSDSNTTSTAATSRY